MFNPYKLRDLLNSSVNPFYSPVNPISLRWGLEITKNVFILEKENNTCLLTAPFTLLKGNLKEMFPVVVELQQALEAGQFSFKSSKNNSIEVIYEVIFSKSLIEDVDAFQELMDQVYEDIKVMTNYSKSVEDKLFKLSNLKNKVQKNVSEEEEEDIEEEEFNLDSLEDSLQDSFDEDEHDNSETDES
jgi:hypothetical protein